MTDRLRCGRGRARHLVVDEGRESLQRLRAGDEAPVDEEGRCAGDTRPLALLDVLPHHHCMKDLGLRRGGWGVTLGREDHTLSAGVSDTPLLASPRNGFGENRVANERVQAALRRDVDPPP